jgi:hypothetical protein
VVPGLQQVDALAAHPPTANPDGLAVADDPIHSSASRARVSVYVVSMVMRQGRPSEVQSNDRVVESYLGVS